MYRSSYKAGQVRPWKLPSVDNLTTGGMDVTLNGTTVSPDFYYVGADASASGWADRSGNNDLALASGIGNYNQVGIYQTSLGDLAVDTGGAARFITAGATSTPVGLKDFLVEMVAYHSVGGSFGPWMSDRESSGTRTGFALTEYGSDGILLDAWDGGVNKFTRFPLPVPGWYHVVIAMNRSGTELNKDFFSVINGIQVNPNASNTNASEYAAIDMDSATAQAVYTHSNAGFMPTDHDIVLMSRYSSLNWLASGDTMVSQVNEYASRRWMDLTGGTGVIDPFTQESGGD